MNIVIQDRREMLALVKKLHSAGNSLLLAQDIASGKRNHTPAANAAKIFECARAEIRDLANDIYDANPMPKDYRP